MLKRLYNNISVTLVEVLVAMLILSSSAAGVLGSFSYAFKFVQRAGKKLEAMNIGRLTQERYYAILLADANDARLANTTSPAPGEDITADINAELSSPYDGKIYIDIKQRDASDLNNKLFNVTVDWVEP